jgi:hypothetical protein
MDCIFQNGEGGESIIINFDPMTKTLTSLLFFLTIGLSAFAQNDSLKPLIQKPLIEKPMKKVSLLVKVKFIPVPLGKSLFLLTAAGADFRFFRNHSVGLTYFRTQYDHNEKKVTDNNGKYYADFVTSSNVREVITMNYRLYFNPIKFNKETAFIFYAGLYYRIGQNNIHYEPLFTNPSYYYRGKDYSKGAFFGMLSKFTKHIGYDFNIGVHERKSILKSLDSDGYHNISNTKIGVRLDFGLTFIL